jgi:hypothetical protein
MASGRRTAPARFEGIRSFNGLEMSVNFIKPSGSGLVTSLGERTCSFAASPMSSQPTLIPGDHKCHVADSRGILGSSHRNNTGISQFPVIPARNDFVHIMNWTALMLRD